MFRGLWRLTWLEIKIFAREPLGFVGSTVIPVLVFIFASRFASGVRPARPAPDFEFLNVALPVFASVLISLSAVMSLITIIAIYREGGILKRLRATPLRPATILTAHVLVKLLFTAVTLLLLLAAGRRIYPPESGTPLVSFAIALVISTWSILSMGFLIASLAPTARFAQPLGATILYPMLGLSGLFVPIGVLPLALKVFARAHPITYAVSLLQGIWTGEGWWAHLGDIGGLVVAFLVCVGLSSKLFRWE
jgi:ABC-2 type transport system permease protein